MASADTAIRAATDLQEAAKRHLWMHFTRMGAYDAEHEVPIIVRGEGAYVYDEHGKRYLDGLSALFCVNAGHGRTEIGDAMAEQVRELDFVTIWSYAHPRAIELAERIASLAPGDLNRVFFTNSGSRGRRVGDQARRAPTTSAPGNPRKIKFLSRDVAYHGTTLGALQATGITALRTDFEPLVPGGFKAPNTNSYHWPADRDPLWAADQIEEAIEWEGPETVAAVILEPLQNAGGCFVPQDGYFDRVREICDRHNVLLVSDEVICAWGRLGHYFGCERYGYQPDIVTTAKALTSAYAPMGAMIASDRVFEPFSQRHRVVHPRLDLRRSPGGGRRGDGQPRHLRARGPLRARARQGGRVPGDARRPARHPDRRRRPRRRLLPRDRAGQGPGDQGELQRRRSPSACCAASSPASSTAAGSICRADDRGDPVIQLSPPLICDSEQFEEIESVLRPVLTEAAERLDSGSFA